MSIPHIYIKICIGIHMYNSKRGLTGYEKCLYVNDYFIVLCDG